MDGFEVALKAFPGEEMPFVGAMRTVGRLPLADAIASHRHASTVQHTVLVAGIDRARVDHVAGTLDVSGAEAWARPYTNAFPMIGRAIADFTCRWNALRRVAAEPSRHNPIRKEEIGMIQLTMAELDEVGGGLPRPQIGVGVAVASPVLGFAVTRGLAAFPAGAVDGAGMER